MHYQGSGELRLNESRQMVQPGLAAAGHGARARAQAQAQAQAQAPAPTAGPRPC